MNFVKDVVGFLLLLAGIGTLFVGVHGASADHKWGGPAIGAGVAANVIAYRVLRPSKRDENEAVPLEAHVEGRGQGQRQARTEKAEARTTTAKVSEEV